MEMKPLKIAADIMWAFLDTPNQMSGKYQVDLCNLSPKAIAALEDIGVNVRNKEGKGFFVTAKSIKPVSTLDSDGVPITVKVGNGSKGVALVQPYAYKASGKAGVAVGINKLVVTDLIEYNDHLEDLTEGVL